MKGKKIVKAILYSFLLIYIIILYTSCAKSAPKAPYIENPTFSTPTPYPFALRGTVYANLTPFHAANYPNYMHEDYNSQYVIYDNGKNVEITNKSPYKWYINSALTPISENAIFNATPVYSFRIRNSKIKSFL